MNENEPCVSDGGYGADDDVADGGGGGGSRNFLLL